jgi:hypothetical protein
MSLFCKCILLLFFVALPLQAQIKEDNALILAVKLNQTMLDEITSYTTSQPGIVLLPLGELSKLLGLAITVKDEVAEGWFISPNRKVSIDCASHKVFIEGKEHKYMLEEIQPAQGDIYVSSSLLSHWLPIDFRVSLNELTLNIKPREELPIEKKMKREEAIKQASKNAGIQEKNYPILPVPFKLFDYPTADNTLRFTYAGSRIGLQGQIYLASDLLYHTASIYLNYSERGINDFRMSLGKTFMDNKYITAYGIGETLYPGQESVALPYSSAGLFLTNFPVSRSTQADIQVLSGDLPAGNDLEIYNNEALIAFATSRPDGRYEVSIALLPGMNRIRIVRFGINGEITEATKTYNIADQQTKKGELLYRVVANGFNTQYERATVEGSYGISKQTSISTAVSNLTLVDRTKQQYFSIGLQGYSGAVYAKVNTVMASNGGYLIGGYLQTRINGIGITASHSELSNYYSEAFPLVFGEAIKSRSIVRLDTTLPLRFPVSVSVGGSRDYLGSGGDITQLSGRIGMGYKGINVSNTLLMNSATNQDTIGQGTLLISKYLKGYHVQSEIDYSMSPMKASNISATLERTIKDVTYSGGINHSLLEARTHYLLGITRTTGKVSIGASIDYAGRNTTATVSIGTSLSRNPFTGSIRARATPSSGGAIVARTLLNNTPLGNVGFTGTQDKTNNEGLVYIPLPANQYTNVSVATNTLEDPSLTPSVEGIKVFGRQGKVIPLEIPITQTGDLSGVCYLDKVAIAGIEILLIDYEGKTVSKIRSGFDGYFYQQRIKPAQYKLRIKGMKDKPITITSEGLETDIFLIKEEEDAKGRQ